MSKRLAIFVAVAALLPLYGTARAQSRSKTLLVAPRTVRDARVPDSADLLFQRDRLELDKQRLASDADIENRKLAIEREKMEADTSVLSRLSSMAPWIVAFLTLAFSILSLRQQAQLQFELKAAEVAFAGKTPRAVANRAKALKAMFPRRLPDDFVAGFDPEEYGGKGEPSEGKLAFLESVLKDPKNKAEVFDLWQALFPGDEKWLPRVEALCRKAQVPDQARRPAPDLSQDSGRVREDEAKDKISS